MNKQIRTLAAVTAALSLSGCVTDSRDKDVELFDAPLSFSIDIEEDQPIYVRLPAGEIEIVQSANDRLNARAVVLCADQTGKCAQRLSDLSFVSEEYKGGTRLAMNKGRASLYRDAEIEYLIEIPMGNELFIDVTAGDVEVDVTNCIWVNMEAGDFRFSTDETNVRSVKIDTGLGDASIIRDGTKRSGARSLLVGAEIEWTGGPGECDVRIDLQAGDAEVELR